MRQRYSRFVTLHDALLRAWGKRVVLPPLPPKKWQLGGLAPAQIEERQRGLEAYLAQLLTVLNWSVEPNLRAFLECDRWLKERRARST